MPVASSRRRQGQARAVRLRGVERLEQVFPLLFRQAWSAVMHLDACHRLVLFKPHVNGSVVPGLFNGIQQQVHQHLREVLRIEPGLQFGRSCFRADLDIPRVGLRLNQANALLQNRHHGLVPGAPAPRPLKCQQIRKKRAQPVNFFDNRAEVFGANAIVAEAPLDVLDGQANAVERIADFVRDARDQSSDRTQTVLRRRSASSFCRTSAMRLMEWLTSPSSSLRAGRR